MKQHKISLILVAIGCLTMAMLSACHHKEPEGPISNNNTADTVQQHSDAVDTASMAATAEWRRADVKVHVRRGQALAMQTEGLMLTAIDAAVQHDAVYSVTSLTDDELPLLPQGMMNMTAATAGYRLLPSGEHFSPYAELRVAYDPERLPEGYTPEDIYTSYYDTTTYKWVRLERLEVDTVNRGDCVSHDSLHRLHQRAAQSSGDARDAGLCADPDEWT
ncbi:MAG: hypothetical protein K5842_02145 [Bacteroidales bacterium]|nr:hypothetical protein [Bacteroidales bacterium]